MLRKVTKCTFLLLVFSLAGCGEQAVVREKAETIAKAVSSDVATVKQSFQGTQGAPILVIEEQHNSRAIQLQEAINLWC